MKTRYIRIIFFTILFTGSFNLFSKPITPINRFSTTKTDVEAKKIDKSKDPCPDITATADDPWSENFENISNELPCFIQMKGEFNGDNINTSNLELVESENDLWTGWRRLEHYGNHSIQLILGNSQLLYRWFISPTFITKKDHVYKLQYDLRIIDAYDSGEKDHDNFGVIISTDNGETWTKDNAYFLTTEELLDATVPNVSGNFVTKIINFTDIEGPIKIAFYTEMHEINEDAFDVFYLDNIMLSAETAPASTEAKLLSFKINEVEAEIDEETKTVKATLPFGTLVTSISPEVSVSNGATYTPNGTQDFTNPVKYTVTAEDGETKVDYMVTIDVLETSISEILKSQISIYPNPNNGMFLLQLPSTHGTVSYEIFDIKGNTIMRNSNSTEKNINIALNVSSGIYTIKIEIENQIIFKKIFVK